MAHGKKPGTISKILAPSSSPCPSPRLTNTSQEEQRGLATEVTEHPPCTLKDDNNGQLTPSVSANHYYMSCDPSPEDMDDTCSEYDNVGSDVEQDFDEVLHLNREGIVDMQYYKRYCPEYGGYVKHAVGDNINENSSTPKQTTPRPQHSTETCEVSQSDTKPYKVARHFRSHGTLIPGDEAERSVKSPEDRFFFRDGDEMEEVLDGAKFIEDLEEAENNVQSPSRLYQTNVNEGIKKGGDEREREEDTRATRSQNVRAASKKCESSHVGSKEKERQGQGRVRRGTGEDVEHIVSGIKGCMANSAEQRPKTVSKDSKKAAVRTKARSSGFSKQHPPPRPRHSHAQPPAQPHRETAPVPITSPSSASTRESEPRVIKQSLAPHLTLEQQREPPEERQRRPEEPQQVNNANGAVLCQSVSPAACDFK